MPHWDRARSQYLPNLSLNGGERGLHGEEQIAYMVSNRLPCSLGRSGLLQSLPNMM